MIILTTLMLSGCGQTIPDMTEEQSAQIAEYAAGLLMKYDTHHESRLLNDAELEKELARLENLALRKAELAAMDDIIKGEEAKKKEEKKQTIDDTPLISQGESVNTGQYVNEFYNIEGITIKYQGYRVMDEYPDSGDELYFGMQATTGKKLLVLDFMAKNETSFEQTLDMLSVMPTFKVEIDGEKPQYVLATLLTDDLANYRGTLAAGEEVQLVLVAEIKEEKADNIQTITLKMQNESNIATILTE